MALDDLAETLIRAGDKLAWGIYKNSDEDFFGNFLKTTGLILEYAGFRKKGKRTKELGHMHGLLMAIARNNAKDKIKVCGFDEAMLLNYLSTISATMALKKVCNRLGYGQEFNEFYDKYLMSERKNPFTGEYWNSVFGRYSSNRNRIKNGPKERKIYTGKSEAELTTI